MTAVRHASTTSRALGWGVGIGAAQAEVALAFWWVDPATVHALMVVLIAAVYIGFAVSDGRTEVTVASIIAIQILLGVPFQS